MREFNTGAKRDSDTNKESYVESISWLALRRYAMYMKPKEELYGRGNWKKGIPIDAYEDSLMRHISKYFLNKYENAGLEPDEDHLAAALFNLQGLLHEEEKLRLRHETTRNTPTDGLSR